MQDTVIKEKGKKVMLWKFSCQLRNDAEICKITDRIGIGWNQALSWEIVGKKKLWLCSQLVSEHWCLGAGTKYCYVQANAGEYH